MDTSKFKDGRVQFTNTGVEWLIIEYMCVVSDAPSGTRSGVDQYEAMEVDEEGGPGPQRCKFSLFMPQTSMKSEGHIVLGSFGQLSLHLSC